MRLTYLALPALSFLVACSGGELRTADSMVTGSPQVASSEAAERAAAPFDSGAIPASTPILPAPSGNAVPVTGAIIDVKMVGDTRGYRFEPSQITAKPGDGIKFVVVSGGPHEIAFDLDAVPPETRLQLLVNMPNGANGRSPLLSAPQETWTLSLGGLKPGKYPFISTPRLPQGMKGEIEIK